MRKILGIGLLGLVFLFGGMEAKADHKLSENEKYQIMRKVDEWSLNTGVTCRGTSYITHMPTTNYPLNYIIECNNRKDALRVWAYGEENTWVVDKTIISGQ